MANLRKIFDAAQASPCALFLDECDTLARSRMERNDVGEVTRITNGLLEMLEHHRGDGLVIAATNLDSALDTALFRRFDEVLKIPLPGIDEIERLLRVTLSAMETDRALAWRDLAQAMDGMSGSEVVHVGQNAAKHSVLEGRKKVSKPVRLMLDLTQLRPGETFFDYGCGRGTDVTAVRTLGHEASGWDPAHASESPRAEADVVNLGFVINVIEDPAERVEVLLAAWKFARRLLVVSTLIRGQEDYAAFRCCGDGVLTSRHTFQKYFEPAEVQALLEDALGTDAVPVAMGSRYSTRAAPHRGFYHNQAVRRAGFDAVVSSRV